ncbi:MAG: winged helix-turn-helix domain-containing protein [Armatimonadota bacterium]|nr:winged helix-turn-helix domain-containing protein [Armatimonadota bacterium]
MDEHDYSGLTNAFDMLFEEIERVMKKVNESGSQAFSEGRYDDAKQMIAQAKSLNDLRLKAISLGQDLQKLCAGRNREDVLRRNPGRLAEDWKTSHEFFYIPILQVLCEMGGGGRVGEVLDRVYDIVKDSLKPADMERLPGGRDLRWRTSARGARWYMVQKGLLKADSPRGVWEISEAGREWLERHKNVNEI